MSKIVNILGATGSVGQAAIDIILAHPDRFIAGVITAHENVALLAQTARRTGAQCAAIFNPDCYKDLKAALAGTTIEIVAGGEALSACGRKADLTIAAIVGMAGLRPLLKAIPGSASVALANKEALVSAGPFVMEAAHQAGTAILPLDSEHNAIFQVFEKANREAVKKLILTASGGPFREWDRERISRATQEEALAHPNWRMGPKITVDCAGLMNKGFEVIEAHYLFDMPPAQIDVVIHPQSVIHSMVEYNDGSILAQLGASDMRTPLCHVMGWPHRIATPGQVLDWRALLRLDFSLPDAVKFPALKRAYDCLEAGLASCVILNAANEIAVEGFLKRKISFSDIMDVCDHALQHTDHSKPADIQDIFALDKSVRMTTLDLIKNKHAA